MPSPTEEINRLNRAIPIVFALIAGGINSQLACMSSEGDWTLAAQLAGMDDYTPSTETQRVIVRLLVQFEAMQARMKAPAPLNPEGEYLKWAAKEAEYQPPQLEEADAEV